MKVFNVLSQDCDIFGKKILEASAGTGKTFAIEHIALRLLIQKDSLITIDQILVVTFTKKAAKEIKYRIRNNIEKAILFLANKEKGGIFDYLNGFINDKEVIFRLQNAIDLFDASQIFTIHSFCFKNLKEFSIDADVLIENQKEAQNTELIKKLIYDYFKFRLNPDDYSKEQIEIIVNDNTNIEELCQKIVNEIELEPKAINYKGFNESYEDFLKQANNFKLNDANAILDAFSGMESNYKKSQKFKNDDFIGQLNLLISILNEKQRAKEKFQNLLKTKCSLFEFLSEENKKKSKASFELPDIFLQIRNLLYPIIKEAADPKILFKRLLRDVSNWLNSSLDETQAFTYEKILFKMKKAIEIDSFKKKVQSKYKALIIDEFQDTDSLQFEIFDNLFFNNNNNNILAVYLIGDPKQSIYSFRKADLYTYLKASNKIKEIKYLDTNFRSSKSLIDSLNAVFGENFAGKWLKLPQLNKTLNYLPVKSGLNADFIFQDRLRSLHFFIAEDSYKSHKWPTDEMQQNFFTYITNEILRLKKENGFSDGSFAVLVNDRYQAQRLKHFFSRHSIKSATARSASLKNSNVINAMKEFFEAVLFPHDLNKIKIALKGPYIKLDDEIIKNIQLDKDGIFIEKFLFLRAVLKKGICYFFNSFFYSAWLNKTILENIACGENLKFYHETICLIELLISQPNLGLNQIIKFLRRLKDLDEDNENLQLGQIADSGVQILTTFMAKGLEYEIVFALGLANRNKGNEKESFDETDAEKMRQFYVALTRAKYRAYVPIAIDSNEKEIKDGSFSCVEYFLAHVLRSKNIIKKENLFFKLDELKNYISYSIIDSMDIESGYTVNETPVIRDVNKFIRKFDSSYIYSFSSLSLEEKDFLNEKKQDTDFPAGQEIGILFHKIFEKIFSRRSYEEKVIRKIIQDNILDEKLYQYQDWIFEIIQKTLRAPLIKDNDFCLEDISFENLKPEREFLFSIKNDYMKGFIDLIFIYDNKYYIADWKTNFLGLASEDYDIENLERNMLKHNYFLQAAIYAHCLKRHLKVLKKDFNKTFGGVFYIFLRGLLYGKRQGIYHFFPDLKLLDHIDKQPPNNIVWNYE